MDLNVQKRGETTGRHSSSLSEFGSVAVHSERLLCYILDQLDTSSNGIYAL